MTKVSSAADPIATRSAIPACFAITVFSGALVPQRASEPAVIDPCASRPAAFPSRFAKAQDRPRRCGIRLIAMLLAGVAIPVAAQEPPAEPPPAADDSEEIIVIGFRDLFRDITSERDLDAESIAAYGVNTIEGLLAELGTDLGDDEEPVVVINGERVLGLDDIADFPVEAVRRLEVLPRGSATRVGGSPQQRVYSLELRNRFRSLALAASYRVATKGDWSGRRGEAIFTRIRGSDRLNVTFRIRDEDALLESDRGIVQPAPPQPYDQRGNVVADPAIPGEEIDPALSALVGMVVTRAAVPTSAGPSLADFAANANRVNETDIGRFRTLVPASESYELNLSTGNRLAPWLRSSLNGRLNWSDNRSLLGLPFGTLILPSSSAFSPFTGNVGIEIFGADPLRQRYSSFTGGVNGALNANAGDWLISLTSNFSHAERRFTTDRQDLEQLFETILIEPARNPFVGNFTDLLPVISQRTRTSFNVGAIQARATGSPFAMPAGPARATIGAGLAFNALTARRSLAVGDFVQRFSRDERTFFANGEIPLASRRNGFLPELGELSLNLEFAVVDPSDFGAYTRHTLGLAWSPQDWLRFFASTSGRREPPDVRLLGNPVLVTPGARYFDFLTGETIDVVQITGGNASLRPERERIDRVALTASPARRINLQLNAELTFTRNRDFVSSLAPASIPILLAFPDRFVRDANGILTTVDLRPINLGQQREDRLRYGFSFVLPLGSPTRSRAAVDDMETVSIPETEDSAGPTLPTGSGGPRPRLQVSFSHILLLNNDVLIRPGLPRVDLLEGGAIGVAGGVPRHQLNGNVTVSGRGLGASVSGIWRSANELDARFEGAADRLRFSPYATLNLRGFIEGRRLFPGAEWLRGSRFTMSIVNLANDRQRVVDSLGNTPLQFQPGYRDPLGRTVEFEFRKVF